MFYLTEVEDYVRVEPKLFGIPTKEAVEKQLGETYSNYYDKEMGKVVSVVEVMDVGDGIIIPGDGAAYYKSEFKVLTWKPEINEISFGIVSEITTFGAFINLGVMQGMIHISQTMNDFVSFSKTNLLVGKVSKKSLKKGDLCLVRIVAISHKGESPKIGLTMRQPGLGKLEWIKEEKVKKEKAAQKAMKAEASVSNKKGGKKK
ncbi:DNA-directed RNA polymerase [Candidatus Pacearchaeota archaeon CG10_big_fil_rev_8_21_14_0_10_34_12]|nr:MAG: DNA-directed RNA polymerase [Candidatus Pacearchaeota archaeon CG10_big_fil_rev_8_21_14_0_10_34_12]